jgi:hypothetical protein
MAHPPGARSTLMDVIFIRFCHFHLVPKDEPTFTKKVKAGENITHSRIDAFFF